MPDDEDYYTILGVDPDANADQIKESYRYKAFILHSDRLADLPERVRLKAEEDFKKVNRAYDILSNPDARRRYDINRSKSTSSINEFQKTRQDRKPQSPGKPKPVGEPKPEVYPRKIYFKDVLPYAKQQGVFFVRNVGGPYTKVLIGKFPEWVRLVETKPLQSRDKLPMRVQIEAMGIQWGKVYSTQLAVRLDDNEARVEVRLRTQKKPH
jgi:curved DNA-binding protein CbpA